MAARVPYLEKRGSTYRLRLPIPVDLQPRFKRKELRWSLHTKDRLIAKLITFRAVPVFELTCNNIRAMPELTSQDIMQIARSFFAHLLAQHELPGAVSGDNADLKDNEQDALTDDVVNHLQDQIERRDYGNEVKRAAEQAIVLTNTESAHFTEKNKKELLEAIARAKVEEARHLRFRQGSAIDPYAPHDPLFRDLDLQSIATIPGRAVPAGGQEMATEPAQGGEGGSLGDLIKRHLEMGASDGVVPGHGGWAVKTLGDKKKSLRWLEQMLGADKDVRTISNADVRDYRDALKSLRRNQDSARPLSEITTSIAKDRIQAKTADKYFVLTKSFLNWLESENFVEKAPGSSLTINVPHKPASEKRRPFSDEEICRLFSLPHFIGCSDAKHRHEPGDMIIRDDYFWMPLVLLYTGMRMAEPLQVHAIDVVVDTDFPFFRLLGSKINLKNLASEREVPIHPDLLSFGFREFVRQRIVEDEGDRLFRGIPANGGDSGYYSKKFGALRKRAGITDRRVVGHSFRHLVVDRLREAEVPADAYHRITGHSQSDVSAQYGVGHSIEKKWTYMAGVDFGLPEDIKARLRVSTK